MCSSDLHITQKAYELNSGTLSWEGSAGQLFSITNNLTSGSIFSVNDVSGIPSIDVNANGTVSIAPYGGNVAIGSTGLTGTASQPLQVSGGAYVSGSVGIGITNPSATFQVGAAVSVYGSTGIISATKYYGDGSSLTGVSAGIGTEALVASGIVTTLNLTKQDHKITATGITTITVSGGTEGDSHTVRIVNSGIATVGFSTYFLFPSGSPPTLPTTSGAISLLSFTVHRVGTAGTQLLAGASLNFS